ncbi:MAG: DUF2845 domain-containing protein [Proteobacteria bacterium]|nr:DUF2845 domain-containing protein [Pseudomonadota bacterium]
MRTAAIVCALLCAVPAIGTAEEFRCGEYLVSADLSVSELLRKCGQPTSKKVSVDDVRAHVGPRGEVGTEKVGTTRTEVWRYDRGPRALAMIVTIVDGTIQKIENSNVDPSTSD